MDNDISQALGGLLGSMPVYGSDGSWSETAERSALGRVSEQGWTRVGLAESLGGAGGGMADALAVTAACAASGHLLPLADVVVCSTRLLSLGGLPLPETAGLVLPVPVAGTSIDGRVTVSAVRVPWARWASHLLVVTPEGDGAAVHLIDATTAVLTRGGNLAGEPRDDVVVAEATPAASGRTTHPAAMLLTQLQLAGALARSVAMAASIGEIVDLTAQFCSDRRQFGRPINAFQAVQQELAGLAGEAAAANAATSRVLDLLGDDGADLPFAAIAAAKVRTGLAATAAARAAHQLHGAIGITIEYALHRYTRPLWSWREEYGNEHEWAAQLAADVVAYSAIDPWSWVVGA
jgi:acyl-CoA dehydrogenase